MSFRFIFKIPEIFALYGDTNFADLYLKNSNMLVSISKITEIKATQTCLASISVEVNIEFAQTAPHSLKRIYFLFLYL